MSGGVVPLNMLYCLRGWGVRGLGCSGVRVFMFCSQEKKLVKTKRGRMCLLKYECRAVRSIKTVKH